MNQENFSKKIEKKYGVSESELANLSISKIKNLKINEKRLRQEKSKLEVIKKPIKGIMKGAGIGASVAGIVNTVFPNLVPVVATHINATSNAPTWQKFLNNALFASKPVDIVSGHGVIGIGAGIGILAYSGYKLIKNITNTISIANDRRKAGKSTGK